MQIFSFQNLVWEKKILNLEFYETNSGRGYHQTGYGYKFGFIIDQQKDQY